MIDKFIEKSTKGAGNISGNVEGQISQAQNVAGGVEGFKKQQGIRMKAGGFIAKGCGKVMSNRRKKTKVY